MTIRSVFTRASLLVFVVLAMAGTATAQSSPFHGLSGTWSGSGTVSLSDGSTERLRCRANYTTSAGDAMLQQTLRCASDGYKFELSGSAVNSRGDISGSWSEASRGIGGDLKGNGTPGRISVTVDSPTFSATLTLTTRGDRQTVSITSGGDIRKVTISMIRS
jgi:hypothetical protein